jgi:hypothetical protein
VVVVVVGVVRFLGVDWAIRRGGRGGGGAVPRRGGVAVHVDARGGAGSQWLPCAGRPGCGRVVPLAPLCCACACANASSQRLGLRYVALWSQLDDRWSRVKVQGPVVRDHYRGWLAFAGNFRRKSSAAARNLWVQGAAAAP